MCLRWVVMGMVLVLGVVSLAGLALVYREEVPNVPPSQDLWSFKIGLVQERGWKSTNNCQGWGLRVAVWEKARSVMKKKEHELSVPR